MAKKLRDEINLLTMDDTPNEYISGGQRHQVEEFHPNGFRANIKELMGVGNYDLYSLSDVITALNLMGVHQSDVDYHCNQKVVTCKKVKFKKLGNDSAHIVFPNIVGGGQNNYIQSVTIVEPNEVVLTAVNNGVFVGDFTSIPNATTEVDIEVRLNAKAPTSMVSNPTISVVDQDLADMLGGWLDDSTPISLDNDYNPVVFNIEGSLNFSAVITSITLSYIADREFTLKSDSNDLLINGVQGTTTQTFAPGDTIVLTHTNGVQPNCRLIANVGTNLFQFVVGYTNTPLSWTLDDQNISYEEATITFNVNSDYAWSIVAPSNVLLSISSGTPNPTNNEWLVTATISQFTPDIAHPYYLATTITLKDADNTTIDTATITQVFGTFLKMKSALHLANTYKYDYYQGSQYKYPFTYVVGGVVVTFDNNLYWRVKGFIAPDFYNGGEELPWNNTLVIAHAENNDVSSIRTLFVDNINTELYTEWDNFNRSYETYYKFKDEYKADTLISAKVGGTYKVVTNRVDRCASNYTTRRAWGTRMIVFEGSTSSDFSNPITRFVNLDTIETNNVDEYNMYLKDQDELVEGTYKWYQYTTTNE